MSILDPKPCLYCGRMEPLHAVTCEIAAQLLAARQGGGLTELRVLEFLRQEIEKGTHE